MRRVRELDGLRALAILAVFGCHFPGFAASGMTIPSFGWVGVDIFFGLSGYLITSILLRLKGQSSPYRNFYSRRFVRILPPYLAVSVLIIVIGLCAGETWVMRPRFLLNEAFFLQAFPSGMRSYLLDLVRRPRWYALHLPNLLEYAHQLPPGLTDGALGLASAPGTFWSLSVEEYFYLLWAPVVLTFSRPTVAGIGLAACLLEAMLRWSANTYMSYVEVAFRFDALLYGALLALLFDQWQRNVRPRWSVNLLRATFLGAVAAIAVILYVIHPIAGREIRSSPLFMVFGLPMISIAAVALLGLLVLHAESGWWFARLMRTRLFQSLGTISYTMYLLHIVVATVVVKAAARLHTGANALFAQAVFSSVVTILLARASWHYFEKPLLRWKDRTFPSAPSPPAPALD